MFVKKGECQMMTERDEWLTQGSESRSENHRDMTAIADFLMRLRAARNQDFVKKREVFFIFESDT